MESFDPERSVESDAGKITVPRFNAPKITADKTTARRIKSHWGGALVGPRARYVEASAFERLFRKPPRHYGRQVSVASLG